MKRALLHALDPRSAEREISEHHGHLTHRLSPNLFIVRIPDSLDVQQLASARPAAAAAAAALLTAEELDALEAFTAMEAEEAAGTPPPGDGDSWATPGREGPRGVPPGPGERDDRALADWSSYLMGEVAVGLVIVSGPGKLKFSDKEITKVKQEVMKGLDFLQESQPTARLTFTLITSPVTITTEKDSSCKKRCDSTGYESCEELWRAPAMTALGYPGPGAVGEYARHLRASYKTSWSYVAYFTKYPLCHFAYASIDGVKLVMEYDNDGWGVKNLHRVFAHESGHIFCALDEYKGACECEEKSGYFDAPNKNCVSCSGKHHSCLMDRNTLDFCYWTRRQLGWGAFGHQTNVTEYHGAKSSEGPALAQWSGAEYLAYKEDGSSKLSFCKHGESWGEPKSITADNDARSKSAPSLSVYRDKLYLAWKAEKSGHLMVSSYDGLRWSSATPVTDASRASTAGSPAICAFDDKLYMLYRSTRSSNLYLRSYDGVRWSEETSIAAINGARTSATPALAVFDGELRVAYVADSGKTLHAFSYDGSTFSVALSITKINGASSSTGPALGVINNLLYLLYRDGSSDDLACCTFTGEKWLAAQKVTAQNEAQTGEQPALALRGSGEDQVLLAAYRGTHFSRLWTFPIAPDAPMPDRPTLEVQPGEVAGEFEVRHPDLVTA